MAEQLDCVVIGAGVVGLAVARALALRGREVVILEAADDIGTEISSRNSEVIHAGIYYPADSLKATLCAAGRDALYERCEKLGIPHRRTGKLIVATSEAELATLEDLLATGRANAVPGLRWIDAEEVGRLEPRVRCLGR